MRLFKILIIKGENNMNKSFRKKINLTIVGVLIMILISMPGTEHNLKAATDQTRLSLDGGEVLSCPENLVKMTPSRTVMQIINNTFYKWNEYELDNGYCLEIIKPYYKHLTAYEAVDLLMESRSWEKETEILNTDAVSQTGTSLETILPIESDTITSSDIILENNDELSTTGIQLTQISYEDLPFLSTDDYHMLSSIYSSEDSLSNELLIKEQTTSLTPLLEAELDVIYESESNDGKWLADNITTDYNSHPACYIYGSITNNASDFDYYRIEPNGMGFLDLAGLWVGDLYQSGDENGLEITLLTYTGDLVATTELYGSGSTTYQALYEYIENRSHFLIVKASEEYGDKFVNQVYGLIMDFAKQPSDPIEVYNASYYNGYNIGYLTAEFPNGNTYRGTGVMISPTTALTAGHLVYNADFGGYATIVNFAPGQVENAYNEIIRPFEVQQAHFVEISSDFIDNNNVSNDIAAIHFRRPFETIDTFMPIVIDYNSPSTYVTAWGYPSVVDGESSMALWKAGGHLDPDTTADILCYNVYADGGSVGSPIIYSVNDYPAIHTLMGILTFGNAYYRGGPRFTSSNQHLIEEWMTWEGLKGEVKGYAYLENAPENLMLDIQISITNGTETLFTETDNDGYFSINGLYNEPYELSFSKSGYLTRKIKDIIINDEVIVIATEENPITLWGGDFDGVTGIDTGDLAYMISRLGYFWPEPMYDGRANFDRETGIDTGDLAILIKNLGATTDDYPDWIW